MSVKTANLAIVFTDIKGFTELTSHQTLEQNQHLLTVHASLLSPLFRSFGGRIVKSIGDAYLVAFESPTQAVLSGVAIQDRVWDHNRDAPSGDRFEVRIAINVGEVRLEPHDVFGEPVNIASRVEGITEAGEVFFTEAVYLAMDKAEVPSQEVGWFELKGIPGKIRVFRVPKGPYRVEAPVPHDAAAQTTTGSAESPPFGNLGLRRLPDNLMTKSRIMTAELSTRAADLGTEMKQKATVLSAEMRQKATVLGSEMKSKAAVLGAELGTKAAKLQENYAPKVSAAMEKMKSKAATMPRSTMRVVAFAAGVLFLIVLVIVILK